MINFLEEKVKIGFVDFWNGYEPENWFIYKVLSKKYEITIDNDNPEILFCSCFGNKKDMYKNVVKIYYTGENRNTGIEGCDYSITFNRDDNGGRNLYLPLSIMFDKENVHTLSDDELLNRKFCNFIYFQNWYGYGSQLRQLLCIQLMKYKYIDCPGRVLHNFDTTELKDRGADDWEKSKIDFIKNYKFTIAVENSNTDGYMTEKLLDPLLAGSVPIYWGSNGNTTPFPKDCMICVNDFDSFEELISRIKEVDENDEEYLRLCRNNPIRRGSIPSYEEKLLNFFEKVLDKVRGK